MRQPQQIVEQTRRSGGGIILDRQHRRKTPVSLGRAFQIDGVAAKADALLRQVQPDIGLRQQHRAQFTIIEERQKFERFRTDARAGSIGGQLAGAIGGQAAQDDVAGIVQIGLSGHDIVRAITATAERRKCRIDQPGAARKRTANHCQEQIVDIHLLAGKPRPPGGIDFGAKGIGRGALQRHRHRAPQDMMVQRQMRVIQTAQQGIADGVAIVQIFGVGGFKGQAGDVDELAQHAIAGRYRRVVDVMAIWQS